MGNINLTSEEIEIISIIVGMIVSIVAVIISMFSLKLTQKSIEEANRPYVVVYRDYIQVSGNVHEYVVIKNFGKTGAKIESVVFEPVYTDSIRGKQVFKNIKNTFIAPGQSISTTVSHNAFLGDRDGIITATIRYSSGKKIYEEKITLNEDLINDLTFTKTNPPKSQTIQTVVTKTAEEILRRNL